MNRYSKKGDALPELDITGQKAERGAGRVDLGNGYIVRLRGGLNTEERDRLLEEIRKEIARSLKKSKTGDGTHD